MAVETYTTDIEALLGDEAEYLLQHRSETFPKESLHLPGPDFVDRVVVHSDRNVQTLRNLQGMFSHGRLGGTGYLSILPVDQGIEHSAGASFAPNPEYFDPENIVELAIEGGCNAVASTFGVLGMVARKWAHEDPLHRQAQPQRDAELPEHVRPDDVRQRRSARGTWAPRASARRSTSAARRAAASCIEISEAFSEAHDLGMFTVLWCYLRNSDFKKDGTDYSLAADLTGQANHLGVTIEADIIKQKLPENNGGFTAIGFGKTDDLVYSELTTDHPIDLCRYQVANCYMGRAGLINSGGASKQGLRHGRGRAHRGDQQARGRHGPDLRPQGVPASDERGRRDPQRHPGRLPLAGRHDRLTAAAARRGERQLRWVGEVGVPPNVTGRTPARRNRRCAC